MKIRTDILSNYKSIFVNGKTFRMRINPLLPILSPQFAEIEDVAINTKCYANCDYCYVSALKSGINFDNIVEKAYQTWGLVEQNNRPFQIAIGGAGEPTLHPDFVDFVKSVNELGIMPNYTTNGMHLSTDILEATEKYCGGVALSYHPHLKSVFEKSIKKLSNIKTRLNIHIILGTEDSFKDVIDIYNRYCDIVDYFVILPYQVSGRAKQIDVNKVWLDFFDYLPSINKEKFAFGALFYDWLLKNDLKIKIDIYEPEMYSGYRMMNESYNILRVSSYNPNPKKLNKNETIIYT